MKSLFQLITFFCCVSLGVSCSNIQSQEDTDDFIVVSFNVSFESLDFVNETPISKASEANGLYGVQINLCDEHDNKRYCYGIFDDISLLQVKLKRNERYSICMDYFPNGKNEIPYKSNNYSPLQVMPWNDASAATLNTIVYSNYFSLDYLCKDYQTTCDRYCYWNENYVANDNSVIPIKLLRMNAGITIDLVEVEGKQFEYVVMNLQGKTYSANVSNGEKQIVVEKLMLDMNQYAGIEKTIPDLFYLQCNIGTPEHPTLFYDGDIEIKRNTMRTYSVKLETDIVTSGFSISYDSSTFEQDNGGYLN